jgi:hypothetical protein
MARRSSHPGYPATVIAGVAIAGVLCLWGSFSFYATESAWLRESRDPFLISAQSARFASLLSAVPESAILGYITDTQPGSTIEAAMFLSAQYTLAPRLLHKGAGREWVLGNFTSPADFAVLGRNNGLRLQHDFGNGVVLYRKEP